jgi:DNA-binding transcriptional LysR family regulator
MKLRSIDLNLLAVFDAIAAEGNLTRAANRLRISQPAMSNALVAKLLL